MKKLEKLLFSLCLGLLCAACGGDDGPAVSLSQTDFKEVSYEGSVLELQINTALDWTATSMVSWCTPSAAKGSGSTTLKLDVSPNLDQNRSGKVVIWTSEAQFEVTVSQNALPAGQEYHYKIPVIFHVFYADRSDRNQYVEASRFAQLLAKVNSRYRGEVMYKGGESPVDMNMEFVLADTDEAGNALTVPGVEYIQVASMPIDCSSFMGDSRYVKYLWDPNSYINVMVYNFASVEGGIILGISHLPFTVSGAHALEGLGEVTQSYLTKENLGYPKCVSINSLYIYEDTGDSYNSMDANVTLGHELGHYLGLHHAFDETDSGDYATNCVNSDYCEDTPSYNRNVYMANLMAMIQEANRNGVPVQMAEAVKRENCKTGQTFSSYNIMDYEVTYADRFTEDQRKRIRHVLSYSPLIPGPKKDNSATRTAVPGVLDLPMIIRQ